MSFPMGGMTITDNDVSEVKAGQNIRQQRETFVPIGAAITVYPAGLLLGRVTAGGKLTPYVAGAGDGSEVAVAVLPFDATSDAVPTEMEIEAIVQGEVNAAKLVTNVPAAASQAEKEMLRSWGILPIDATELAKLDNS